jgi:hypothetical protein
VVLVRLLAPGLCSYLRRRKLFIFSPAIVKIINFGSVFQLKIELSLRISPWA